MRSFLCLSALLVLAVVGQVTATNTTTPFTRMATEVAIPRSLVSIFACLDARYDCANHGICNRNGDGCICDKGYDTYGCDSTVQCCYAQENRIKMFLLAFFFSYLGVPYFMVGAVGLGVGMLVLCCGGICVGAIGQAGKTHSKGSGWGCCALLEALAVTAVNIWAIVVWAQLAAETEPYNDKHGVPIAPW